MGLSLSLLNLQRVRRWGEAWRHSGKEILHHTTNSSRFDAIVSGRSRFNGSKTGGWLWSYMEVVLVLPCLICNYCSQLWGCQWTNQCSLIGWFFFAAYMFFRLSNHIDETSWTCKSLIQAKFSPLPALRARARRREVEITMSDSKQFNGRQFQFSIFTFVGPFVAQPS